MSLPAVGRAADTPATAVSVWPVRPVPFAAHIETIGQVEPFQGVTFSPEIAGRITELDFDSGRPSGKASCSWSSMTRRNRAN